jgi:anaerobic ribonucleoside-triphosphate reductase activating protein
MGGEPDIVNLLAQVVHKKGLKVGWYWGGVKLPAEINLANFEYIKIGPYIKELGPLSNPKTNQRMYEIIEIENEYGARFYQPQDITYKFWK